MRLRQVEGAGFKHLVIDRVGLSAGNRLHVYIEGDGIPWHGNLPNLDPTPINTLALRLSNLDTADIAYVGRPCYFGEHSANACNYRYWTSHRYGEAVVHSMAEVIERIRQPRHHEIVLIGHSGGGTLATLLESRVAGVVGVVTIAANLDVDAWTKVHRYDPLTGSLNPIEEPRVPSIPHWQFVGGKDSRVPLASSRNYSRVQPNVDLIVFEKFGHVCCWEREWPDILADVAGRLDSKPR